MMDRFRMLPNYRYYDSTNGIITTAYERHLRDYKIYGNSVQNGTPSPDNPIEIQSVGDYDEETGKYKISIEVSNENGDTQKYNIFLDEPLRKCGDYVDYIDLESSKVVRTVGEYTFSGNEYIDIPGSVINGYTPFRYQGLWSKFKIPLMCNYFSYKQSNYGSVSGQEVLAIYNNQPQLFFIVSNSRIPLNDVSAFKKWLSDLYAAGNPIKVMGGLANPTETEIDLPEIKLNKGTNTITVKTATQPSAVSYQYYA